MLMQLQNPQANSLKKELDLIAEHLQLDHATLLELGCGTAQMTRQLALRFPVKHIIATEVDGIQHEKNLASVYPATIEFRLGGAQAIEAADNSIDAVFMFKSLHHVPHALMDQALQEVARVLKPGGHAWISEPVFAGEYNEILRLFHNEQQVRKWAFEAIGKAVEGGRLTLVEQLFFDTESLFAGFEEFEQKVIQVTHTQHALAPELHEQVKQRFMQHMGAGGARFESPQRVDLLRKPL